MSDTPRPRAPAGLGAAGRRLWASVLADYDLSVPELELLRQAAGVADLIARASAQLADDDLMVAGSRGQPVVNPLVWHVASQRRLLESLIRSMALPFPDEHAGRRRSPAQVAAAQERWRKDRGYGQARP
jgi:hypothetical protein